MSTKEAAARLSVGYDWLKLRAARNEVPHLRLGRLVRFTEDHIAQIIRDCEQDPARLRRGSARSKL